MTSQIVQCVLEEAEKRKAKKVLEVYLVIGKLTFLGIEQVRFAYESLVKDTIMEGSKLIIEERDGLAKCPKCGYKGSIEYQEDPLYHIWTPTLKCPKCGENVEIIEGKECTVKSVKLLVE